MGALAAGGCAPARGDGRRRAALLARALGYRSAGTVEFLLDDESVEFFFLEVNARLQVEHPVTEMVTGVDLVKEPILVAAGSRLSKRQDEIQMRGHAIECRINAEDPDTFMPSPGQITTYHPPGGPGVRIDGPVHTDARTSPYYDSMVAKLIAHGETRDESIARMRRALDVMIVEGIRQSLERINAYLVECNANHGGVFATSQQSDTVLEEAHQAMADLLNASRPEEIVFGNNMTTLSLHISRSVSRGWKEGDEIVVTRLDHDANITPWILAAQDQGVRVNWVDFDVEDGTLKLDDLQKALERKPRLLAVGYATNSLGTINPLAKIIGMAHDAGTMVYVDAVQYAPHGAN